MRIGNNLAKPPMLVVQTWHFKITVLENCDGIKIFSYIAVILFNTMQSGILI